MQPAMMSVIWLLFLVLGHVSCAPNSAHSQSDLDKEGFAVVFERFNEAANNLRKVVPDSNKLAKTLFPGYLETILGGPRRFIVATREDGKVLARPVMPVATDEVFEAYTAYFNWMADKGKDGYAYLIEGLHERDKDLQGNRQMARSDPHRFDQLGVEKIRELQARPLVPSPEHESGSEDHGGTTARGGHPDVGHEASTSDKLGKVLDDATHLLDHPEAK
jgi:hypothetical protein